MASTSRNLLDEMLTDDSGLYLFDQLIPGDYQVEFVPPDGYVFTLQDEDDGGPNPDARDSDADITTGRTIVTTLVGGEIDLTWDAGLYRLAALGDYVWEDLNIDGMQDAG